MVQPGPAVWDANAAGSLKNTTSQFLLTRKCDKWHYGLPFSEIHTVLHSWENSVLPWAPFTQEACWKGYSLLWVRFVGAVTALRTSKKWIHFKKWLALALNSLTAFHRAQGQKLVIEVFIKRARKYKVGETKGHRKLKKENTSSCRDQKGDLEKKLCLCISGPEQQGWGVRKWKHEWLYSKHYRCISYRKGVCVGGKLEVGSWKVQVPSMKIILQSKKTKQKQKNHPNLSLYSFTFSHVR